MNKEIINELLSLLHEMIMKGDFIDRDKGMLIVVELLKRQVNNE